MLKIRLRRVGAKGQPMYRVVIAKDRSPRDGAVHEVVGYYNPLTEPPTITLKQDRIEYWLGTGARPTESVEKLLATYKRQQAAATETASA